jgi:N-glycosylase/DNA lyase
MRIQADHFDMIQIAESGQCFRWSRQEDGSWSIPFRDKCLIAEQKGDNLIFECTEEEFDSYWKKYFDMETDYGMMEKTGLSLKDPFLERALHFGSGIRILRQDFWETLISFLISQNNNIPRIRHSIEKLCDREIFPSPGEILMKDLTDCRLGYREKYLREASKWMIEYENGNQKSELSGIMGVGPKVEACVRLYGLHELNFCPMDTWMKKIVAEDYHEIMPDWMHSKYAGYYQQVCFYYKRMAQAGGKK